MVDFAADSFRWCAAISGINQTLERSGRTSDLFGVAPGGDVGGGHLRMSPGVSAGLGRGPVWVNDWLAVSARRAKKRKPDCVENRLWKRNGVSSV